MSVGEGPIIIDNTNTTRAEAEPYIQLARIYGYDIQVVSVSCGLDEAMRRNAERRFDRRVPENIIHKMYDRLEDLL